MRVVKGSETRSRAKAVMLPRVPDSQLLGNDIVRTADIIDWYCRNRDIRIKQQKSEIKSSGDNNCLLKKK